MSLRSIRKWDDPALKVVCVDAVAGSKLTNLVQDLTDTLRARLDGVGLAAPQIGSDLRVIAIQPTKTSPITVMVNPVITHRSDETEIQTEGCLSYPGVWVDVERSKTITVRWMVRGMAMPCTHTYEGFTARIIQHEIDHLDGICKVGEAA